MSLPDPLPTDADELEALYQRLLDQEDRNQEDVERVMEARLRALGIDPDTMTPEQLIAAMQESMSRMLLNLRMAAESAPDADSLGKIAEVLDLAEQLRQDIDKALQDVRHEDRQPTNDAGEKKPLAPA